MAKEKIEFVCKECGDIFPKWLGQCPSCSAWNTLEELKIDATKPKILSDIKLDKPQALDRVQGEQNLRISIGFSELDKTLGGGLVVGSVVLIGGSPGIGKSTLILQVLALINQENNVLYVSGEESKGQIKNRAMRLNISSDLLLLSSENLESVLTYAKEIQPKVLVIDSIQTIMSSDLSATPGSVSQIKHCAGVLTTYAKQTGIILIMIGHITKDGSLAGPKILEHMVDAVLHFEGDAAGRYRILRSVKNRFGAVNEISVFAMLEDGLKQVKNPSGIFLSTTDETTTGRVVVAVREGSRPMLIELQALVDNASNNAKRVCVGLEQNRLILMLAILSKHLNLPTYDQDVFVNVVGGVKITETASDLALLIAIYSSKQNIIIDAKTIIFGEVGLTGEVRPVYNAAERLREAKKQGFNQAIIPLANKPKQEMVGMKIIAVKNITQVLKHLS
jgi:DNA repair protein RadA/Sms